MTTFATWASTWRHAGTVLAVIPALLATTGFAPAGAPDEPPQFSLVMTTRMPAVRTLLAQFERIAYSNEFGGAPRRGRIVKWAAPIRVEIRGASAGKYRVAVLAMLHQLRRLSGLNIRPIRWYDFTAANFIIEFVAGDDGTRKPKADDCITYVTTDYRRFVITAAHVIIGRTPRHCIVEELTQALGLGDDSRLIYPSVFNDASVPQGLFPWDAIMVRVLYEARLYPGIRMAAARPIVRAAIARFRARAIARERAARR